jgi:hypothetical protein
VTRLPIIGRNRITGEIAAGFMKNVYQFTYYGAWWWDNEEKAEAAFEKDLAELGIANPGEWEAVEISEERLKLLNVKLNNDPRRRLYVADDGSLTIGRAEHDRLPDDLPGKE